MKLRWTLLIACCAWSVWLPVMAAEPDLTAAREALQAENPTAALSALGAPPPADHIPEAGNRLRDGVVEILRGQALLALERTADASAAFTRAVHWAPDEAAARDGLLHSLTLLEDWPGLLRASSRYALDPQAEPRYLLVACDAAMRAADPLIAIDIARRGATRFPQDVRFRTRLAQALSEANLAAEALSAWTSVVRLEPQRSQWWRALAAARQRSGDAGGTRQALAIAYALDPDNRALGRDLLVALLAADHSDAALTLATSLLAEQTEPNPDLILLGVRAAWQATAWTTAQAWLDRIPTPERSADWRRWQLHLALVQNDAESALAAARELVAHGEADAAVRLQAARLALASQDNTDAESWLRPVLLDPNPAMVHLARLELARLLLHRKQHSEAASLIDAALSQHPDDPVAQAMRAVIKHAAAP